MKPQLNIPEVTNPLYEALAELVAAHDHWLNEHQWDEWLRPSTDASREEGIRRISAAKLRRDEAIAAVIRVAREKA